MMNTRSNGPFKTDGEELSRQQKLALESIEDPSVDSPNTLKRKSKELLSEFGYFTEASEQAFGFAYGGVGLLAQHTSYYDGFAVVLSLSQATSVAVSFSERDQHNIVFDKELLHWAGASEIRKDKASYKSLSHWQLLIEELLDQFLVEKKYVDLSVVSSIPPGCMEAFFSAMAVGVVKAVCELQEISVPDESVKKIRGAIQKAIDAEFSKAFVMASQHATPGVLSIIDTATEELIPFDTPLRDQLSWGLIEVESGAPKHFDFYQACGSMGDEALDLLKESQFSQVTSYRDVQHADLQRILKVLPQKYRPIVRHLVNENKRVQAMIGAIRGEDWQKLGGLLFISHSSLSNEWHGTNKAIDFVVSEAEQMSPDGIYGACMTGRGGFILIVGLTMALPRFFASVTQNFKAQFKREVKSILL